MRFWDISLLLGKSTIAWPGDVKFSRVENRGSGITSKLELSTHTGTHIDAPKHFLFDPVRNSPPQRPSGRASAGAISNGVDKSGVDRIALSKLIGPARVVEVGGRRSEVGKSDLAKFKITNGERILLKTGNSKLYRLGKFTADYVSLSLEGAQYLAKKKIALVGIDYLGIEAKSAPGHPVHKTLLAAGIVNLEGLDLSKVKPGNYNLIALPLRIKGSDGSPCRAILWK